MIPFQHKEWVIEKTEVGNYVAQHTQCPIFAKFVLLTDAITWIDKHGPLDDSISEINATFALKSLDTPVEVIA